MRLNHTFSIAPMMAWTDRHCRAFHRLLSPDAVLYTEMLTTGALLHGDSAPMLAFSDPEHPVVLQLGGSDPADLARCASMAASKGYDEVNLNIGCPSERVQKGAFGACLMSEPALVAECVRAMQQTVEIPVSVKCRIGVDQHDSYDFLARFVDTLATAGVQHFIIHARTALLKGLSPAQNREIPPLRYPRVHAIKSDFPELTISLNGGITSIAQVHEHLARVDGVMLGRAAYKNPWLIAEVSHALFRNPLPGSRSDILDRYLPYVEQQLAEGTRLHTITRHLHGLFNGLRGARQYRRFLSENDSRPGADTQVLLDAASQVREETEWPLCSNA